MLVGLLGGNSGGQQRLLLVPGNPLLSSLRRLRRWLCSRRLRQWLRRGLWSGVRTAALRGPPLCLCASMCADLRRLRRMLRNRVWPALLPALRPKLRGLL